MRMRSQQLRLSFFLQGFAQNLRKLQIPDASVQARTDCV